MMKPKPANSLSVISGKAWQGIISSLAPRC